MSRMCQQVTSMLRMKYHPTAMRWQILIQQTVPCVSYFTRVPFVMHIFARGARFPQAWRYWLCKSSVAAVQAWQGFSLRCRIRQNGLYLIPHSLIRQTSPFLPLGPSSPWRKKEKRAGKDWGKKKRGRNRERQLESSASISKTETVCQRSCCAALLMQNCSLCCQSERLTKHFRLVIVMCSLQLFLASCNMLRKKTAASP